MVGGGLLVITMAHPSCVVVEVMVEVGVGLC